MFGVAEPDETPMKQPTLLVFYYLQMSFSQLFGRKRRGTWRAFMKLLKFSAHYN